ncbi:bifunctional 4-hydroxy-2-oxoglutarate aldolase/2-dehydro-3-deoxy-phosphogluconate aldolase, partial [Photobacterium sp. OFAV2-7]|uniref:bifunctional 4-hydroxy-2-oxoglutarate aldolase/2-dehydro-3-deoxy-phosphogluconate aldolase n=1 Tax=Photobacterium sp. OFAV2-7 TaxID=2917748 RepID=UPI001EF4C6E1
MTLDEQLQQYKVIPVVVVDTVEQMIQLGKVLCDNGLPVAEITFRTTAAADAIRAARKHFPEMLIGAGTVLTPEQAIEAKEAGASFVVTPAFNPKTVKACQEIGIDIIPGVNSPYLVEQAMEMGLRTLKFFPAEASGGIPMLKAMLGPYQDVCFMPTGGINEKNIQAYLDIPRVLACGG